MYSISDVLKFVMGVGMLAFLIVPINYQQVNYDRCVDAGKTNCAARYGMAARAAN